MLRALVPPLAYSYISLVGATSRIRWEGMEHVAAVEAGGKPYIYAFWHQRQVLFTYTHRGKDAGVLVSRSKDGDLIAETMRLSRIPAIRGSSSRGAAQASRELLEALARGRCAGITPDGPKGPARKVKAGAIYLAQKSGCPILPIANASSRVLVFERSWDRFMVPLPFGRVCVHHAPPFFVLPGDDPKAKAAELEGILDRITREADLMAGGQRTP